jgi:hypothetical protein
VPVLGAGTWLGGQVQALLTQEVVALVNTRHVPGRACRSPQEGGAIVLVNTTARATSAERLAATNLTSSFEAGRAIRQLDFMK